MTLGVGFAALNTGNNLLYLVFSLMLSFLVLSGVLSESALRGIRVTRRLPRELYAGAANPVRLEVQNDQRRISAFAIVVEDRGFAQCGASRERESHPLGRVFLLRIGANETASARYQLTPERRGEIAFAPMRVSTRFPFGLFVKSRVIDVGGRALVYPELLGEQPPPPSADRHGETDTSAHASAQGSTVSGVREFRTGDPLRRIHWKSSLRRRSLLVLQVEEERDAEVEVELVTTRPAPADSGEARQSLDAAFERRVSRAATEVVAHLEAGLRVGLRTEGERIATASGGRQRERLLAFLARIEARERAA